MEETIENAQKNKENLSEMSSETQKEGFNIAELFIKLLNTRAIAVATSIVALVIVGSIILNSFHKGPTVTTETVVSLKEMVLRSDLRTLEVPYNTICKVLEDKKKETDPDKVKYYTAYEGTVTFGIDFTGIELENDLEKKVIRCTLPEVKVVKSNVDVNSISTIYVDEKYKKENNLSKRRLECSKDLQEKIKSEENVNDMAITSTKRTIENLIMPIVKKIDRSYTIEWK